MSIDNSSPGGFTGKPNKPYPEFPLCAHAMKRGVKRIYGMICCFGPGAFRTSLKKVPRTKRCPLLRPQAAAGRLLM